MAPNLRLLFALLFALTVASPTAWASETATPVASPVSETGRHGIDPANMDLSVDPAKDFYCFANGGWLNRTAIPADEGSHGVFDELDDLTKQQLLSLLGGLQTSGNLEQGSDEWKAVQLFGQGTDLKRRNAQGIEPIQPILDDVDAISNLAEFHDFQSGAAFQYLTGLFYPFIYPGLEDSSTYAAYLSGPFFGLPNRDYYLEDDAANQAVRDAYVDTCARLLVFAGYSAADAATMAQAVYDLERTLVKPTLTREEQQDVSLFYNPMTLTDLKATYPLMDWAAYFKRLGLPETEHLIVTEKRYLEALDKIVRGADLETLKAWVNLEVMWSFAGYLSEDIEQTAFDFKGGVLGGVKEQDPIEERVLDDVNGMVGEAVGKLYVDEYFPPEAKDRITTLVDAKIAAFWQRLMANPWMTDETRAVAIAKLDKMAVKVGYPDKWRSYERVKIEGSYAQSFLTSVVANYQRDLDRAGKPVDDSEWSALPQEVNAFYDPFKNDITFPAAILQPPFFDYQADPAVNFGGIGFVIGHEITHGFDLQGSQFDAEGNLAGWWSDADAAAFQSLNDEVVTQYGAIEVLPGLFIDGQITVTENVADLGGVQVAFDALRIYLAKNGAPGKIDGFTQDQRFFISAATVWREKIRDEALTTQVKTDEHAPASARSVQPIRNMDEFYDAFAIGPGDPMYLPPAERIVVW